MLLPKYIVYLGIFLYIDKMKAFFDNQKNISFAIVNLLLATNFIQIIILGLIAGFAFWLNKIEITVLLVCALFVLSFFFKVKIFEVFYKNNTFLKSLKCEKLLMKKTLIIAFL